MVTPRGIVDLEQGLSVTRGIPLGEEEGIGALTLGGYLREITGLYAANEALVLHLDGAVIRWSYAELWEQALSVAKALIACGAGKGTRVGVLVTNRPEFLASVFGAALAGTVPTPISTFFTATEIDEVLRLSGVSVLLFERKVLKKDFAETLLELEPQLGSAAPGELASLRYPYLRHCAMVDTEEGQGAIEGWSAFRSRGQGVSTEQVLARTDAVHPSDPGILLFSSGSTGKVKAILSAGRGACLQLWRWAQWYDLKGTARVWSANGFFWSGNFCQALGGSLSNGGAVILQRWFDPEEALSLMEREKASMLVAWPHQWAQLIAAPNYASVDLSSLHYIDRDTPIAQHPTVKTDWKESAQAYGNTETFTLISVWPAGTPPELTGKSHGVPTAGATIKVIDPFTGVTKPLGERGEIAVKGPTLMLGYLGTPLDETLDGEGFLRTSDGGYIDEQGRLFWEGRLNDIIKTGGANVSPLEIDDVIRNLDGVKLSQTVGVPDDLLGELVVTCVVRFAGATVSEDAVKAHAKLSLASYKVPRRVLFFAENELTTTGNNKIITADLRKLATGRLNAEG